MSNALASTIAKEVAALINTGAAAGAFGTPAPFQAERRYAPVSKASELATLKCFVVAITPEAEMTSRRSFDSEYPIDICIQKSLTKPEDLDELDALSLHQDKILDYLFNEVRRLLPCGAGLVRFDPIMLADPAHIRTHQVYTNVYRYFYRVGETFT